MDKFFCSNGSQTLIIAFLATVLVPGMGFASAQNYAMLSGTERDKLRETVVTEARDGKYEHAISVLEDLYLSDKNDLKSAYDYMTILHWAGKNEQAIDVYEQNLYDFVPEYVALNIASAYYRLNQYDRALVLLYPLVEKKNIEAMTLQGQIYIKQNNPNMAEEVFDKIVGDAEPEEVLRIKTETAIGLNNWQWPAALWRRALIEKDRGLYTNISRIDLVDKLAIAYLRIGRDRDALKLLQPYIENRTASVNMIGNYIIALRRMHLYVKAIDVYRAFFGGEENVPVFILREIAECFYEQSEYIVAAKIYNYIQTKGYAEREDKFRLGYIACHTKKYGDIGVSAYEELLEKYKSDDTITRILVDAQRLLQKGKLKRAGKLYEKLANNDERFYRLYIDDLIREEQYQTAWHVAQKMAKSNSKELSCIALEKLVSIAIAKRDYQVAASYKKILSQKLSEEYSYSEAAGNYKNRLQGEMYVYADAFNDDDDSDSYEIGVYGTQYLGDSIWGELESGRYYVKEHGRTISVDVNKLGLRYSANKFDNFIGTNLFHSLSDDKIGLSVDSRFRPDDRQEVHFTYDYAPVIDADALEYERGSVFADEFALRYTYYVNQLESYYVELKQNNYDFDNKMKGWQIGQELQLYNDFDKERTLKRSIFWGRNRYSNQDVPYTSPELQESIGINWKWGKKLNENQKFFHILGFNWERDYPDKLTLNPLFRIEYERDFSDHQYITVGMGYELKSQNWLGKGSWKFNNSSLYFNYNLTW